MFEDLQLKMAAFRALGELMDGSGCVSTLVIADVAATGASESFLKVSYLAKNRRGHQVTSAALYILMGLTYNEYKESLPTPCVPLEL